MEGGSDHNKKESEMVQNRKLEYKELEIFSKFWLG